MLSAFQMQFTVTTRVTVGRQMSREQVLLVDESIGCFREMVKILHCFWVGSTVWRISCINSGHRLSGVSLEWLLWLLRCAHRLTVFWGEFYQQQASDLWGVSVLQPWMSLQSVVFVILLLFRCRAHDWAQSLPMPISRHRPLTHTPARLRFRSSTGTEGLQGIALLNHFGI